MHRFVRGKSSSPVKRNSFAGHQFVLTGFNLLVVFWILNSFFPAQGLTLIKVSVSLFLLAAVMCFALQIVSSPARRNRGKFDSLSRILLGLLMFWFILTILRGFSTDASRLYTLLANPNVGGLVWLLPFAVYIGRQPGVLPALLPTFRWHALIGITLVMWTIFEVTIGGVLPRENAAKVGLLLLYPAPFVLLTAVGSRWDRRIYMAGMVLAAVAHFCLNNRASFAMSLGVLLLSVVLGRVRGGHQVGLRIVWFVPALVVLIMFGFDYVRPLFEDQWFIDTRSFLLMELNDDFSNIDWIVGRGALGEYYSPYFAYLKDTGVEGGDWMFRQVNEIGYLHLALKTGLVGAVLYFFLVFRAAYLSLGIRDKRFAIGLMSLLALHLTEMLVAAPASFQPSRVLLWILVGLALSSSSQKTRRRE